MNNIDPLQNNHPGLTVVIATLGGEWIKNTIDSLLTGSTVPDEILICIPEAYADNVKQLATQTVKIISTEVKGQVRQRAVGFKSAACPLVLQLDDDILLEKDTIHNLIEYIQQLGKGNVIAPAYYGKNSHTCIHTMLQGFAGFKKDLFDSIVCAAPWGQKKMGVVTNIGINYGVDDALCTKELMQTQWLPGGCVLSFKEDLVTNDFFPFEGKAYCEDVYHSFFRRLAKTKMWVAKKIRVYIDEPEPEFSRAAVEKVILIRRKYLSLINGPEWRLFLYEVFCRIRSRLNDRK